MMNLSLGELGRLTNNSIRWTRNDTDEMLTMLYGVTRRGEDAIFSAMWGDADLTVGELHNRTRDKWVYSSRADLNLLKPGEDGLDYTLTNDAIRIALPKLFRNLRRVSPDGKRKL